jgi:putative ABC transport system ATP-binding protein
LRREHFGFVFQDFNLIPTLTAAENIESALAPMQLSTSARRHLTCQLLEDVGLADRARHLPSQLSGGEQQRVAIARAIANNPKVLFADEPTGNLDTISAALALEVLHRLSTDRTMSLVVVSHDVAVAKDADRILTMSDGQLTPLKYACRWNAACKKPARDQPWPPRRRATT